MLRGHNVGVSVAVDITSCERPRVTSLGKINLFCEGPPSPIEKDRDGSSRKGAARSGKCHCQVWETIPVKIRSQDIGRPGAFNHDAGVRERTVSPIKKQRNLTWRRIWKWARIGQYVGCAHNDVLVSITVEICSCDGHLSRSIAIGYAHRKANPRQEVSPVRYAVLVAVAVGTAREMTAGSATVARRDECDPYAHDNVGFPKHLGLLWSFVGEKKPFRNLSLQNSRAADSTNGKRVVR